MPELPEVEIICQGLRDQILNRTILEVHHLTNLKLRQEIPANISEIITNTTVTNVTRRAKYIQVFLSNDWVLLVHLGMSGKVLIKDDTYQYKKHDHFVIKLNDNKQIIYNDPRRFGLITLVRKQELNEHILIKNLGVEPFELEFTPDYLERILQKKQPIKLALMDNKYIVGVGNIYASESLFLSKISPLRESRSLSPKEIELLYAKILMVLGDSIKRGGSTLKDYTSVSEEKGHFQNSFNVYGRAGESCKSCSNIILKIKQGARTSFYCDCCQK